MSRGEDIPDTTKQEAAAVSYTHLDVYKRQYFNYKQRKMKMTQLTHKQQQLFNALSIVVGNAMYALTVVLFLDVYKRQGLPCIRHRRRPCDPAPQDV